MELDASNGKELKMWVEMKRVRIANAHVVDQTEVYFVLHRTAFHDRHEIHQLCFRQKPTGARPNYWLARGLVVSASALVLVGLEFDSRPCLTKTLQIGTVAFFPGARCAEEHKTNGVKQYQRPCTNSVVALQDHCSYKAPSKTPYEIKKAIDQHYSPMLSGSCKHMSFIRLAAATERLRRIEAIATLPFKSIASDVGRTTPDSLL